MSSYMLQREKRVVLTYMSEAGSPSIMSFYLSRGEKGVVFNICLYITFPVMSFYVLQGEKRKSLKHMCVPGFPCVPSSY